MNNTHDLNDLVSRLTPEDIKMGDIKKMAKDIKKDHQLALALWATEHFHCRMLAVLIMDKKQLTQDVINQFMSDLDHNQKEQQLYISEWLMANQLMKDKKTVQLLESWQKSPTPILRRLFWYHQARLRWTGQTPPANTLELLDSLESDMETEAPEVQWTMNFTAAWIGIFDKQYRDRCIKLGERLGLYKDEKPKKGCTPNYLPEFIRVEAGKRE